MVLAGSSQVRCIMNTIPVEICEYREIHDTAGMCFPFCVFLYVAKGSLSVSFGAEPLMLEHSDLVFLPPGRSLSCSSQGSRILLLGLSDSFVDDHLNVRPLPLLISPLEPEKDYLPLKRHILTIASRDRDSDCDDLFVTGTVYLLLSELRSLIPENAAASGSSRYAERVRRIAEYIDLHYADNFSLTDLANAFYLTPQYLSTFFREHFSSNFKTYLTDKRLFYSLRDLRNTRIPISEIALKNGFTSVSAYQKNFLKVYGCSPSEFRARHLKKQAEAASGIRQTDFPSGRGKSIALANIAPEHTDFPNENGKAFSLANAAPEQPGFSNENGKALSLANAAPEHIDFPNNPAQIAENAGVPVHLSLSADCEARRLPHVNRMINADSVHNLLSDRFRLRLLRFCRDMHITCVRIKGLISSSFIPMILPHYEHYYQNVNTVLSFFFENGITPFIELSKLEMQFGEEAFIAPHYNYVARNERSFRLLESFLRHVTRRWPASWLNSWIFELSMLPRDSADSYAEYLSRVQKLIRTYIPGAAVGGPGYDSNLYRPHPEQILRAYAQHNLHPDFFSASLHFLKKQDSDTVGISSDPDYLISNCRKLRDLMTRSGLNLPLYITEWSAAALPSLPVTASLYQSAFIAGTWSRLDSVCDLAGYSLFCDTERTENFYDPAIYHFGCGLLGNNFMPYASYYAYALCASLGNEVLAEGSFYRFIRAEENHYQLLVFHYSHFRPYSDPEITDVTDFDRVYHLFEENPPMDLRIVIRGLKPGLYRTTRTSIDRDHGSFLDTLIGEYTHSNIGKVEFLQHTRMPSGVQKDHRTDSSLPQERSTYIRISDTMNIQLILEPHAVCLISLRRLI